MATNESYYPGGYLSDHPAQNLAWRASNGSQPSDPTPAGYTAWDVDGNITTQRALRPAEAAALAAQDSEATASTNQATLQQRASAALATNATYLAIASPTTQQAVAQVKVLTQECTALIRLLLNQLDSMN